MQQFIADIFPQGWIHGLTVRSTVPRGRIVQIRLPLLPRGCFAVRAADIPGNPCYTLYDSMPYLAIDRVSYRGEPVLLLAGPDPHRLAELAEQVQVEIEEEPSLLPAGQIERLAPVYSEEITRGDVQAAFAAADRIVEGQYRIGRLEHLYPQTQGAVAVWDGKSLLVYSATQDPFDLRERLAGLLALPVARVRVIAPDLGTTLEGNLEPAVLVAAHAALLSRAAGRPVRIVYTRDEDLAFTSKSHPAWIRHRTGLDAGGAPVAVQVDIVLDAGAYLARSPQVLVNAALAACGAYRSPNLEVRARLVQTNSVPSGAFRGLGAYQAFFAAELHAARLAEAAQVDPYQWKAQHLLRAGELPAGAGAAGMQKPAPSAAMASSFRAKRGASAKQGRAGQEPRLAALQEDRVPPKNRLPAGRRPAKHGPPQAEGGAGPLRVVEEVTRISDFQRKHAAYEAMRKRRRLPALPSRPLRGIGLAVCYQGFGLNGEAADGRRVSVRCRLDVDQRLDILTSIVDIGQGSRELFIRIAARILDIDAQRIAVHPVDTREVPDSGPTSTLRTMAVIGGLLEKCCHSIRRKRLTGSLPIDVRCSRAAPRGYEWDPRTRQGEPGHWFSWAGTVVDLEIDPVTLQGGCRGIWLAIDAGRILDLELARLQAEGAVLQALGCAALEAEELTHGRPGHYADYGVAGFLDIPPIEIHFLDPGPNPDAGGLRELGDLPFLGIAPAYASATVQATGCAVDRLPITPEAIQACLEADGR